VSNPAKEEDLDVLNSQNQMRFEMLVLPDLDAAFNLTRWHLRSGANAEQVAQEAMLRSARTISLVPDRRPLRWFASAAGLLLFVQAGNSFLFNAATIGVGAAGGAAVAIALLVHHHHAASHSQALITGCTQSVLNGISLKNESDHLAQTIVTGAKAFRVQSVVEDYGTCGATSALAGQSDRAAIAQIARCALGN
jgi:hypothetical protein